MTTTEETENDGDSDERGDVRAWHATVARGTGSSKQTTETSRRRRFVEGTTTEMAHRDDHDGGNGKTGTVTSEDVTALAREDVSGDVARSVAERGDYAVSSDCTSGAGTGSSKQNNQRRPRGDGDVCRGTTTEIATEMTTTEETENDGDSDERGDVRAWHATVARGTGSSKQTTETSRRRRFVEGTTTEMAHRDDHDGGNGKTGTVTSEDVTALAREDWRGHGIEQADNRDDRGDGDVLSSVAERGGYAVSSDCTSGAGTGSSKQTTETSEETETFVETSGDVARSVAERGGYAVSSGCTSGAGTGSSKQTTETSETGDVLSRYHYGNSHRDDHDEETENDGDSDERGREEPWQ
ncbi:hypothetical protein GN244_ATG16164 [Phytophthora infestans]|uniref:Uncharacterized protein n=1 Tax=Phytophthora infestans TaxID=4787 RepID=A0A833SR87_PHYIN|nr:hypothetical protein GN244_ATG16164 [Phytophthora infestans]